MCSGSLVAVSSLDSDTRGHALFFKICTLLVCTTYHHVPAHVTGGAKTPPHVFPPPGVCICQVGPEAASPPKGPAGIGNVSGEALAGTHHLPVHNGSLPFPLCPPSNFCLLPKAKAILR